MNPKDINVNISAIPISHESGDAFAKPIASSMGDAGKTILDAIFHLVLDPVRKFNIQREIDLANFKEEVQTASSKIPTEFLDDSRFGIVLKAIEDSRYQLNDEYIRSMFTKLITSTLDARINNRVTPKFSTIISDMSVAEAKLLEKIYKNSHSAVPFVNIKVRNKKSNVESTLFLRSLLFDSGEDNTSALELSLLESSNLIHFHEDFRLVHPHFERIINEFTTNFGDINEFCKDLLNDENEYPVFQHSAYYLTTLGKSFCEIVFEGNKES